MPEQTTQPAPLDRVAVRSALAAAVGEEVVGAFVRVDGDDGPWVAVAGSAERGEGRPVDPEGFFRIGSITKAFVATTVLQLVDEGRIGLDEPVQPRAPGLLPDDYPPITARQLLQHTSGVANYLPDAMPDVEHYLRDQHTWSRKELLEIAFAQPRPFAPGTRLGYSNTNYVLLGLLVEALTGRHWGDEVVRRICVPLGLADTFAPRDERLPIPHATGYVTTGPGVVDVAESTPSIYEAAGSMISTARDVDAFLDALLGGALLPNAVLAEMLTPFPERIEPVPMFGFGLGVEQLDLDGQDGPVPVYGSGGSLYGYSAMAFGDRDGARRCVLALNVATDDALATGDVLLELTRIVFCGR
jgi:D-alanyl-D-alanine carboxypeptidase